MRTSKRVMVGCALTVLVVGTAASQSILFSTENTFSPEESTDQGEHVYRVRVDEGQMIEVLVRSEAVDTYVEGELPGGERVVNDDYDGLNAGFMRTIATGGVATIEAMPLFDEGSGPYELIVREVGNAERITLGEPVVATFDKTDVARGDAAHRYWFRGAAGQILIIDLTSDDFDTYLRVQNDQGREFVDDDGGFGRNSRVSYASDRDGVLSIHVSSFSGEGEGRYELQVTEIGSDPVATYRGEIGPDSDRAYDGKRVESHEYSGRAGETVSILLESEAFDTHLYVSGPSGETIAQDDDGGRGTDSLITVTLPETGTYVIYAVPFLDSAGPYRLSIYR